MLRFHIFFLWEQERTDLKYTKDYIVDETSAAPILDNTERSGIAADHRGMCKFETKEAAGFRTVLAALKRYAKDAPKVVDARTVKAAESFKVQAWDDTNELISGFNEQSDHTRMLEPASVEPSVGGNFHIPGVDIRHLVG